MRAALKVGQVINLDPGGPGRLRHIASLDSQTSCFLPTSGKRRVRVLRIGNHRRELSGNSWWLLVESVTDPTKRGWLAFDTGERLRISALVVDEPEPLPRADAGCEGSSTKEVG